MAVSRDAGTFGLALLALAIAAPRGEARVDVAFKTGPAFSAQQCVPDAPLDAGVLFSWDAGVELAVDLNSTVALAVEARLTQRGATYDPDDMRLPLRMNCVSLPLLVKCRWPLYDMRWFVAAGPRLDLFLGTDGREELGWLTQDFESTDLGVDVSLGLDTHFSIAEIRYSQALTKCYESDALSISNCTVSLLGGIRF